jgi:hypothetical protein
VRDNKRRKTMTNGEKMIYAMAFALACSDKRRDPEACMTAAYDAVCVASIIINRSKYRVYDEGEFFSSKRNCNALDMHLEMIGEDTK